MTSTKYETAQTLESEQVSKSEQQLQWHLNFIHKLKKITKLPSRKLHAVLKKNLVLFEVPLERIACSLDDFILKQKSEFALEGLEEEIIELRYNNYMKLFGKKVQRLKYEVIQYHNESYAKKQEIGQVEDYITGIQQSQKTEVFIENIKSLKNQMLLDQLKQLGDEGFIEEIQEDLLKEQQKLANYGEKQKQKALEKYEQVEQQKNYYRRLDDQQETLKAKFRMKNQALQESIKVKHYMEQHKKTQIKEILVQQKKKQVMTGRQVMDRLDKGQQRHQDYWEEKESRVQQENVRREEKQQLARNKKNSIEKEHEERVSQLMSQKMVHSETNLSKISRSHTLQDKEKKIKQIKQDLIDKGVQSEQERFQQNLTKITRSTMTLNKMKHQKLEQIDEGRELSKFKVNAQQSRLGEKQKQEAERVKEIERKRSTRVRQVDSVLDRRQLEQKVKREKTEIRTQNRSEVLQEQSREEDVRQQQNQEWLDRKKQKIDNIVGRMNLKNAIVRDFQEQLSEKKSLRRDLMDDLDKVLKGPQSSKVQVEKVLDKYYQG